MRKFCFFMLLTCFAFNTWSLEKPPNSGGAGIGLMYSNDFAGKIDVGGIAAVRSIPVVFNNFGIFAYGDFVYAELICALFFDFDNERYINLLGADLGIYGKFPFILSKAFNLFPMLGFEFQAALFGIFSAMHFENRHIVWKQFWFKSGAGLDFKAGEKIHLRFEALYGIRLRSAAENTTQNGINIILNNNIGHGITLRIAIGI